MIHRRLIVLLLCALAVSTRQATAQQHPNIEKGFKADQAYSVTDIDVVNLFNGNLNVSVPIGGTYSVGGRLSYGFTMAYAGNNWDYEELQTEVSTGKLPPEPLSEPGIVRWAVPYRPLNAGMGWLFSLGRLISTPRSSALVYQAPDGSEHPVFGADDVAYTNTGTYIRGTAVRVNGNIQSYKLEFPDGTIKEFALGGRLQKIRDRFDNAVTVTYYDNTPAATAAGVPAPGNACGSSWLAWKIADTHRVHYVYFLPPSTAYLPFFAERVCQANLATFGATRADYFFTYADRVISRQKVTSRVAYWPEERPSAALDVPLLARIELPHGSTYEMLYDAGMYKAGSAAAVGVTSDSAEVPNQMSDLKSRLNPGGYSGHLVAVRMPTKGRYEWEYQRFAFPPSFGEPYEWDVDPAERWHPTASAAVFTRKKYVNATPDTWTYSTDYLNDDFIRSVRVTTVDGPDGSSTENYFSLYRQEFEHERDYDYGAPYTRRIDAENPYKGMYISSRTTIPGTATRRRSYVTYEWDPSFPRDQINNRRLKSRLTVFEDGHETSEVYSDFDGLGHYRTTTTEGTAGSVTRVTWKNYNPTVPANGVRTIGESEAWLTGMFDAMETTDLDPNGAILSKTRTEFCFDSLTGHLARTRSLRGSSTSSTDLLVVFKDENASGGSIDGNVSQEEYYGGDEAPLTIGSNTCTGNLTAPKYRLLHEYQFGSRKSTQYAGFEFFKVLDLTIDASSGLPSATRDTAGVGTALTYDLLGRLTTIAPVLSTDARATSKYLYTEATQTTGPSVTALQECPAGSATCIASTLPEVRYYYDSFGRLVQQRASMGSAGTWPWSASASVITYGPTGRTESSSVAMGVASGSFSTLAPPGWTERKYDTLGRMKEIKQPDASTVTFVYTGANLVSKTAKIMTATGATDVTTTETSDALGRLIQVSEDSTGAAINTLYTYDAGDRLKKVTAGPGAGVQFRTFDYDGAGLLMSEDHPESEPTTYRYDARGHMTRRAIAGSTVLYDFDSAERLAAVRHDPDGDATTFGPSTMKEFTFGTSGTSRGRLRTAKSYQSGIATVTETLNYDAIGLLSSKTTAVDTAGTIRSFTDSYTYDDLGATKTITYPGCSNCGFTPPARQIENFYDHGYLKSVGGYTSGTLYHPNGMWAQFSRPKATGTDVQTTDIQTLAANMMPRPESRSVSGQCTSFGITVHPPATKTVTQGAPAGLSVTAPGATSYQWYSGETTIPNETNADLNVPVNQSTSYWVRVGNGTCTVDSSVSVVTAACSGAATITAPSSVQLGAIGQTARVEEAGTYAWTIQNGTITSASNTQEIVFTAGCSGSVVLTVSFTPTCSGSAVPTSKTVPITIPSVTLSAAPQTILQGSSSTLTVGVTPTGSWSVKWADDPTPINVSGSANRPVSPTGTLLYEVQQINGCVAATPPWKSVTVTVLPPAPLTTTATKSSATSVLVAWTKLASATIDSYRIERCTTSCASGGNWTLAGTSSGMSFNDAGRPANTAYAYRVVSVRSGTLSATSGPRDFASTYAFTDDPVLIGGTPMASHVTELRSAVNALRTVAGLGAYNYTDTIEAGLTMKALHLTQLQGAVDAARSAFGVGQLMFTQSPPAIDSVIRASHINDLRGGVQ